MTKIWLPGILTALLVCSQVALAEAAGEQRFSSALRELLAEPEQSHFEGTLDPNEVIEWEVYVPEAYRPEVPAGLMVYASPLMHGRIPHHWKSLMGQKNLIWISANRAGNRTAAARRVSYAVLATVLAKQHYNIDASRVYISGLSGGGRVASVVATRYPTLFSGAIYNCGVNFWGENPPPDMNKVRSNRYVFVTGSEDFNRRETRKIFGLYRKAGIEGVLLMDIPRMGHSNPDARHFGDAIDFLDRLEVQ